MLYTHASPETEPLVLLAPHALQSSMLQPRRSQFSDVELISIHTRVDQLRGMAEELDTPLSIGNLTVLLAAGTQLKGVRSDKSFAKSHPETPYTPATGIPSPELTPLPEAISKQAILNRRGSVLEIPVNRWTNENLAANAAYALKEPELHRQLRRAYMRIGGVLLGGVIAPAGIAVATEERAWVIASMASLFIAAGDWGLSLWRRSRSLARIEDAGARYRPFAITRE